MNIIEGITISPNARIAIAIARFNHFINTHLLHGALDTLKRMGQIKDHNITLVWVPGIYELPLIVNQLAKSNNYDAIIALGTVIRGDTAHFEFITKECSSGLSAVAMQTLLPVAFGILTTENIEQAIARAGTKIGNKGADAALSALEMINVLSTIQESNQIE